MKKTVYICDVCGKELPQKHFIANIKAVLGQEATIELKDICPNCAKILYERINNVIIEKNNE